MRCTDYGRVNVAIKKVAGGKIILMYEPWQDDDSTVWYCVLNARDGYRMRSMDRHSMYSNVLKKPVPIPLAKARDWLARYCAYHRMRVEDFAIVEHFSRPYTMDKRMTIFDEEENTDDEGNESKETGTV